MDKASKSVARELCDAIAGKKVPYPKLAEIAGDFVQIAGGPRQMAAMIYQEYLKSKEGSLNRQRVLLMVMNALEFANKQQAAGEDMSLLTDQDLDKEIDQKIEHLRLIQGNG